MDSYLQMQILKGLTEGDWLGAIAWAAVFFFLWIELRGLRSEMKTLNGSILKRFTAGEERFVKIEEQQLNHEHRITELETLVRGGANG